MGLGRPADKYNRHFLKIKATKEINGEKETYPHFVVEKNVPNGQNILLDEEFDVSGYLIDIKIDTWENDYGPQKGVKVILVDGRDSFEIASNINTQLGRSLVNILLMANDVEQLNIGVYKKTGDGDKVFPAISLRANGSNDTIKWRYDYKKDLAPLIEEAPDPNNPNKVVRIYHKANNLLLNELAKHIPVIMEYVNGHTLPLLNAPKPETVEEPESITAGQDSRTEAEKESPEPAHMNDDLDNQDPGSGSDDEPEHVDEETDDLPF